MPTGLPSDKQKKWREDYALRRASRERTRYDRTFDLAALDQLRSMGVKLIPVELPKLPYDAMANLLSAEAAAAFDELTMTRSRQTAHRARSGRLAQRVSHRALLSRCRIHPGQPGPLHRHPADGSHF